MWSTSSAFPAFQTPERDSERFPVFLYPQKRTEAKTGIIHNTHFPRPSPLIAAHLKSESPFPRVLYHSIISKYQIHLVMPTIIKAQSSSLKTLPFDTFVGQFH
jgi:hypothetical protein